MKAIVYTQYGPPDVLQLQNGKFVAFMKYQFPDTPQLVVHAPKVAILSFVSVGLMALASLAGLSFQSAIYPTEELRRAFVPNDIVNLLLAAPVLLGSLWLSQQGRLLGLLCLPGALYYALYNFVAYVLAAPVSAMSLVYLALVALPAYAMIQALASIDANGVKQRLVGAVSEKFSAGVLMGFGALFLLRAIGVVFSSLGTSVELAVAVADVVITPVWILAGLWLWRRHPLGYVVGLGMLFQASLLFAGLIVVLLLQSLLIAAPFQVADIVVVGVMGLVCLIPFGLFARGVVSKEKQGVH